MTATDREVVGVLLAAGAGRRAGGPKAVRVDADGTSWLVRSVAVLLNGGCERVVVVLGSGGAEAAALLAGADLGSDTRARLSVVEATEWTEGMGASLRAGLEAAPDADAVLVHLVDLPDVTAAVVSRVIADAARPVLARATYHGTPGHPVLIGADHRAAVVAELTGDSGARAYLDRHLTHRVECGDLATGRDRDQPDEEVR